MAVSINLLRKGSFKTKNLDKMKVAGKVIIYFSIGAFLLQVFYVSGRLVYLSAKKNNLDDEIVLLERSVVQKEDDFQQYVWTRSILDNLVIEKNKEHEYQRYLTEITGWLVNGTLLSGVDFISDKEISFSVYADGVDEYRSFAERINSEELEEDSSFSSLVLGLLNRQADGSYNIKVEAEIR